MMYEKLCVEFYDADKPLADEHEHELELYTQIFTKDDELLEPMCGSGRCLIPLCQKGFNVDGFDNSKAMLASCQERANQLNFSINIQLANFDSFKSTKKYHGIIIPIGSFQLLYPREKAYDALEKLYDWLAPTGKLIMDIFVPWDALYEGAETETSSANIKLNNGDIIQLVSHNQANKFEQHIHSEMKYTKIRDGQPIQVEDEQLDIQWYYVNEMHLLLEKFRFSNIQHVMRNLNGCDRITFIAQK